ncbi:hypothetical protein DRN86_03505 [Candidatus Geothermarchaeota archaeon]|nr:MAG: hypothetical protein DRN86_03505 [Candidatus Geothermarchaeota archaeon]
MREIELYQALIRLFNKMGYRKFIKEAPIFSTIPGLQNKRVDILFINGRKKCAVEVKIRNWHQALLQAYFNSYFFHESYVAIPAKVIKNVDIELFKAYSIGLISVSPKSQKANIILKGRERRW